MASSGNMPQSVPPVRGNYVGLVFASMLVVLSGWFGYAFVRGTFFSPQPTSANQIENVVLRENKGHLFVSPQKLAQLQISHTFELKNSTDQTWTLEFAGASCGCTKPSFRNATIEPGDTTEVTVKIEAAGRVGHVAEYAEIKTGSVDTPRVFAFLEANVHSLLSLSGIPAVPVLVPMGGREVLKLQVTSEQTLKEEQLYPELVPITSATCDAKLGEPVVSQVENLARLVRCPLSVELIAPSVETDADYSLRRQTIEVKCGVHNVSQDIVWRVVSPIEPRPRVVFLKVVGDGDISRQLVLKSDSPFSIRSCQASSESLRVDVETDAPSASHVATISLTGEKLTEKDRRFDTQKILFETDHPQQKEVSVVVQFMAP